MFGNKGIRGTRAQYANAATIVILRLPFFMIVQPVKGIAVTAPIDDESNTSPMVPLSA